MSKSSHIILLGWYSIKLEHNKERAMYKKASAFMNKLTLKIINYLAQIYFFVHIIS